MDRGFKFGDDPNHHLDAGICCFFIIALKTVLEVLALAQVCAP